MNVFRIITPESVRRNNAARRAMLEAKRATAKPKAAAPVADAPLSPEAIRLRNKRRFVATHRRMVREGAITVDHDTFEVMHDA